MVFTASVKYTRIQSYIHFKSSKFISEQNYSEFVKLTATLVVVKSENKIILKEKRIHCISNLHPVILYITIQKGQKVPKN